MIDRHFHWEFLAYNGEPNAETIKFGITVEVIGFLCEADARVAAGDVVVREQYVLRRVWECASCGFHQQQIDTVRELVNVQRKLVDE